MAAETMTIPVFSYKSQEVPVTCAKNVGKNSEFDKLLWSRWDKAMTSGSVFRYPLTDVSTRRIPGRYGFIIQRNIKRNTHRRSPAEMSAVRQPFDPEKFNFNKINKQEILLEIRRQYKHSSTNITHEELYLMIANVSPINYGHVLLVPSPEKCLPQVFTEQSLLTCLELVTLSCHRGFCMVGNSTLAYASVNHLHYHFLYLEPPLMAVTLIGRHLISDCYELHEHPIPSIGFYMSFSEEETVSSSNNSTSSNTISSTLRHCAKQLYTAITVLLDEEIPHNLCVIRGPPFTASSSPIEDHTGIRVLLVPRAPALGYKQVCETEDGIPLLNPAAMELSGFIQIVDQTRYDTVTESEIVEALRQKALTNETFEQLKQKIVLAMQKL